MSHLETSPRSPRAYPTARKSMPFLRGPPSAEFYDAQHEATSKPKTLVARQAAELTEKDRKIKELTARLNAAESLSDESIATNHGLEERLHELSTKLEDMEKELGVQNRMVDFLRDQLETTKGKLFDMTFKEPEAPPRHPAFTRIQGKSEVQWLLQLRAQGWYELEDLATTFAGEDVLGEGFTPKDYTAIIQSVNTETFTVQYSKDCLPRTFYFESPKNFVPKLPLYYKGKPYGGVDTTQQHVEKLMVTEGIQ